jgi:16S rRNA (guanine527-N7)-methyltransferase
MDRLRDGLKKLGLETAGPRVELLERYIAEIELWNPRTGLIAAGEDIVGRHILDSLSGLRIIQSLAPRRLADVGSGAGLPGIPLAIWMEGTDITLIERSGRRAGFLRTTAAVLGLKNVTVLEAPVERIPPGTPGYDVITFRAWAALDRTLLASLAAILNPGGAVAAYKGRRDVIDRELAALGELQADRDIQTLHVPGLNEERHMVLIRLSSVL